MTSRFLPSFIALLVFSATCLARADDPAMGQRAGTFGPEFEFRSRSHVAATVLCGVLPFAAAGSALYGVAPVLEESFFQQALGVGTALVALPVSAGLGLRSAWSCAEKVSEYKIRELAKKLQAICAQEDCEFSWKSYERHPLWGPAVIQVPRVTYKDGSWFQVSRDPFTVEAQASPQTLPEIEGFKDRLNAHLFEAARSVGLKPASWGNIANGGHLNLGLDSTFQGDTVLLRNFLVDFLNHYELSTGVLLDDALNAPTPMLTHEGRLKLARVIAAFDLGRYYNAREFLSAMHAALDEAIGGAVSLRNALLPASPSNRVEVRSLRAQQNADEFEKLARLFSARIEWLSRQQGRIPLLSRTPDLSPANKVRMFHAYVTEAGLPWEDYHEFVPPHLLARAPAGITRGRSRSTPVRDLYSSCEKTVVNALLKLLR